MRESKIEKYLHDQVTKAGGTTRKWKCPGRRGVPDRIVIWPRRGRGPEIHFVETKAPGKKLRPDQQREWARLSEFRATLFRIDSVTAVDGYVLACKP